MLVVGEGLVLEYVLKYFLYFQDIQAGPPYNRVADARDDPEEQVCCGPVLFVTENPLDPDGEVFILTVLLA